MTNKIRIGLIGCGWIVENAHIPAYKEIDNVEIKALFDVDINQLEKLANKFMIKNIYSDIDKFLNCGIDAVVIATPNYTHYEFAKRVLLNKINLLCEKPITLTYNQVEHLHKIAEFNKVVFLPCFVNRFRKEILEVNKIIRSGQIGNVLEIDAKWIRKNGVPGVGSWFTCKKYSGGGVLVDLGSHIVDIVLMFMKNKEPLKFDLQGAFTLNNDKNSTPKWFMTNNEKVNDNEVDVENIVLANIIFNDNSKVNINLAWNYSLDGDYTYFAIKGEKGSINLRTLFGFSTERYFDKILCTIKNNSQSKTLEFVYDDLQKEAFYKISRYFINKINGDKDEYLLSNDALKTVNVIEKLYSNLQINNNLILPIEMEK